MKTVRLPGRLAGVGAVGVLLCLAFGAAGQQQGQWDAWKAMPVTFYDFKSDRSNPEFEQPHGKYNNSGTTARPGMVVTSRLDKDDKPIASAPCANGSSADCGYLNQGVRFWFRDWSALSTYKMADTVVVDPSTNPNNKTYLTKFRPIYTYGNKAPPDLSTDWNPEYDDTTLRWRKNAYSDGDFSDVTGSNGTAITIPAGNRGIENAFENKVLKGQLWFQHIGDGVYQFSQENFFPLDNAPDPYRANGRNPGVEFTSGTTLSPSKQWKTAHNFSFTMEMVCDFTMQGGLKFDFTGDDDVWVFVNGRLAVDVGGIHSAVNASVNLDNKRAAFGGLVDGQKYKLHMFYAERHTNESNIKITTNIISTPVAVKLSISSDPMVAGVPKLASGEVTRTDGEHIKAPFEKGRFTWTARDVGPNKNGTAVPGQQITVTTKSGGTNTTKSDSIVVTATKAYTYVLIVGDYFDTLSQTRGRDSAYVYVNPGPAAKLFIEASGDSLASLRDSSKLAEVLIQSTAPADSNFYAILRDQFGNWVMRAPIPLSSTTAWSVTDSKIATVAPNNAQGRGKATRVADEGRTPFSVTYNGLTGNSTIVVAKITYKAIQVGIKQGGTFIELGNSNDPNNSKTITMFTDADTTLWVRMQRSDNNQWVEQPAAWVKSGLTTDPNTTPSDAVSWTVKPKTATPNGTPGTVTVSVPGGGPSASMKIIVKDNDPVSARFFIKKGTPVFDPAINKWPQTSATSDARVYVVPSASVELTAGVRMPIVGQLFTTALPSPATWLNTSTGGTWTWAPVLGSPSTTCANCGIRAENTSLGGDSATFMSTVAHNTYQIRGTYTKGTITITQDILIRVIPDVYNTKLVIEPNNQGLTISPNKSQRVNEVVFLEGEEQKVVYAVIRDQYENYICPSGAPNPYPPPNTEGVTTWTKGSSPNIVTLEPGYQLWGEWKINRGDLAGSLPTTMLTAKNVAWSPLSDSVKVRFTDYDYSEIQIVKKCGSSGGTPVATIDGVSYCDIDGPLVINSNQDTTIHVVGKRNDCDLDRPGKPTITGNACWEVVTGDWGRDPELMVALGSPPNGTSSWTLVPDGSGRGHITVRRGTNLSDDIEIVITVGPPKYAELVILTPLDQITAGSEIKAVVQYYNRAGLMTEWNPAWSTPNVGARFADTLGIGNTTTKPEVKTAGVGGNAPLYYNGYTLPNPNGVLAHSPTGLNDAVSFFIYYAADGHRIRYNESIRIDGVEVPLTALSVPFTVLAGPPFKLEIEVEGKPTDTLNLNVNTDGNKIISAIAVDQWGNRIGDYPSDWNATTPIPVNEINRPVIVYKPGDATDNGCGKLVVVGNGNPALKDTLLVCITGVIARPLNTYTRDYDGCGYLDRIDMKFRKPIRFKGGDVADKIAPPENKIKVTYNGTVLKVDKVTVIPDKDSVIVWLNDVEGHSGPLQTDWLPTINIGADFFDDADAQTIPWPNAGVTITDGAAPVIASAKYHMQDNYVLVKFSEKVKPASAPSFLAAGDERFPPEMLFNLWLKKGENAAQMARTRALSKKNFDPNAGGAWELQVGKLSGVKKVFGKDESTLRFDLKDTDIKIDPKSDYINIRTADQSDNSVTTTEVRGRADMSGVEPKANNRKVLIAPEGEPSGVMRPIPNPASPDDSRMGSFGTAGGGTVTKRVEAGKIFALHDKTAVNDIRGVGSDGVTQTGKKYGGAVFAVPIYVPDSKPNGGYVKCKIQVYDLAGNLVIFGESGKNENAAAGLPPELGGLPTATDMHLYWNGYNSKSMKVAPGTYRAVVTIIYDGNLTENDKKNVTPKKPYRYTGLVGISK